MSAITGQWKEALQEEYSKEYYRKLFMFIKDAYSKSVVYPPSGDIFNAFHLTPMEKVKVVILGQDPYHNQGQAHGLCFSVKRGTEIPPSLVNIYTELKMTWNYATRSWLLGILGRAGCSYVEYSTDSSGSQAYVSPGSWLGKIYRCRFEKSE